MIINFENDSRIQSIGLYVPNHTQATIERYLLKGLEPGGFVSAIIAGDYERALDNADPENRRTFWATAIWIKDHFPTASRGSYDAIDRWMKDVDGIRTRYADEVEKVYMWSTLEDSL